MTYLICFICCVWAFSSPTVFTEKGNTENVRMQLAQRIYAEVRPLFTKSSFKILYLLDTKGCAKCVSVAKVGWLSGGGVVTKNIEVVNVALDGAEGLSIAEAPNNVRTVKLAKTKLTPSQVELLNGHCAVIAPNSKVISIYKINSSEDFYNSYREVDSLIFERDLRKYNIERMTKIYSNSFHIDPVTAAAFEDAVSLRFKREDMHFDVILNKAKYFRIDTNGQSSLNLIQLLKLSYPFSELYDFSPINDSNFLAKLAIRYNGVDTILFNESTFYLKDTKDEYTIFNTENEVDKILWFDPPNARYFVTSGGVASNWIVKYCADGQEASTQETVILNFNRVTRDTHSIVIPIPYLSLSQRMIAPIDSTLFVLTNSLIKIPRHGRYSRYQLSYYPEQYYRLQTYADSSNIITIQVQSETGKNYIWGYNKFGIRTTATVELPINSRAFFIDGGEKIVWCDIDMDEGKFNYYVSKF